MPRGERRILLVLYVTIFPWNDFFSCFKEDELKRKRRGDHIRPLRHGRKREKQMEQRKKRIRFLHVEGPL
jgi:hypothetical protein